MVAPSNDNFANAQALTGTSGSVAFTNVDATLETGEPDNDLSPYSTGDILGQTVWFSYTPAADGTLTLNATGDADTADTTLEVFTGTTLSGLVLVWSNDDSGVAAQARIIMPVTAGTHLRIRVDSWAYQGPVVSGLMSWSLALTAPANDNFASRQTISSVSASADIAFTLVGATLESGEQDTSGMAGSVWFQVTVPVDKYVLFEVPPGVEVRRYRGTATLAGMSNMAVSNDASRRAFNMGSAFTYFVKLQSATATETGVIHVRPFAWSTAFITPDPVQERGAEKFTRLNGSNTDGLTREAPYSTAWFNAVAGTVTSSNQVSGSSLGTTRPLGWSINTNDAVSYFADLGVGVLSVEWGGTVGPLYAANWPTDPSGLDPALIDGLDFATDPLTSTVIEWDSGTASLVADSGTVAFTAEADPLTDGDDARTLAFYVNPISPPASYTDIPTWPTLPSGGDDTLTLSYTPPSTRSVSGGSVAAPYDIYSHLSSTHAALLVSPSPAEPAIGALDDNPGGAFADMRIRNVSLTATLPVQYPPFKMYGPLPAAGTKPPLRQWPRDDGLRRTPGRTYATSRQGSLRRGPRGSYT